MTKAVDDKQISISLEFWNVTCAKSQENLKQKIIQIHAITSH